MQGDLRWILDRKSALVKIFILILLTFKTNSAIIILTLAIDCFILPHRWKADLLFRVYAGILLTFLGNNFLPLVFLVNPISIVDSVRLFIGDPNQGAKAALTMLKLYQDLPPGGKLGFGLSAIALGGGLTSLGYHDYCCLLEFNNNYDVWLNNQKNLQMQYFLGQTNSSNPELLRQYQLENIKTTLDCLKLKQKFFLHTVYHPGLDLENFIIKGRDN